jgi:hypothetical protein
MENLDNKSSYKEIRRQAKEYYRKISQVWSPVLKDYVEFNNIGFTHLLRKQGMPRAKGEQKRRLSLLMDAVDIIADPEIQFVHEEKDASRSVHFDGGKTTILTPAHFWKLTRNEDVRSIKVIVRQFEGGKKHFYSIYAGKQKRAPESPSLSYPPSA